MKRLVALAGRALRGLGRVLLLPALLLALAPVAHAQCYFDVSATPAGPLTLCPGGSVTLTAAALTNSFNAGGAGFNAGVNAVRVQPDGKVLVGGDFTFCNGASCPRGLTRLNADGSRDAGFVGGVIGFDGPVYALALQADGKVLVGGDFTTYRSAACPDNLVRLNANGTLDAGFNGGSIGFNNTVLALAVQPNGDVLVGGSFTTYNGAACPDRLARLGPAGALDAGFNAGGGGFNEAVLALAVQPDGNVLVGGIFMTYNGLPCPNRLVRLSAAGTLDAGFNAGGAGFNNTVQALALQPNGQVLAGGFFTTYNGLDCPDRLVRLNATGSRDAGFNAGGAGFDGAVQALVVQADGGVLAGGTFTTYNGTGCPDNVVRVGVAGTRDAGFNGSNAGFNGPVRAVALQANGQVLVGGDFTLYNGAGVPDRLTRLNPDGSRNDVAGFLAGATYAWSNGATGATLTVTQPGDYQATASSLGNCTAYSNTVRVAAAPAVAVNVTPAGPVVLPSGGAQVLTATATVAGFNAGGSGFDSNVNAVVLLPDGKVLVGGFFGAYNGLNCPDRLVRLNVNGSFDASFNAGGTGFNSAVESVAVQPDGKVLVGGSFATYNGVACPDGLVRLNANGSLDATFNGGGLNPGGIVFALAVLPNGQVLAGGGFTTHNGVACPNGLVRLNADGSLDPAFNASGAGFDDIVLALAVLPNEQVLVGGSFTTYNGAACPGRLVRLNANGSRDAGFDGGVGFNDNVSSLAVQPDGRVLAGGGFTTYNGVACARGLVRLNADGSRDAGFDGGAGFDDGVLSLALQPDGRVLAGGLFTAYDGVACPHYLVRLNADGSRNLAFNGNNSGFDGSNGAVYALALEPNGRVLAGGSFGIYNGTAAPDYLLRLNANGSLNNAATALPGATFVFNPGNTAGPTRTVNSGGSYTATATDPATGCDYLSNTVTVFVSNTPVITALTPNSGPAGSSVVVSGFNLAGATGVTFNGTFTAAVSGNTATGLTVVVPAGASTGPVTVGTAVGTSNPLPFIVTEPELTVSQAGIAYASNGSPYNFGTVAVGGSSGATTFVLTNTGTAPLTISGFSGTGSAAFAGSVGFAFPVTLAPGGTRNVSVVFAPTVAGFQVGTITFASDAATNPAYGLKLTGNGIVGPAITLLAPNSGVVGNAVTITGSNLGGATSVSFNGTTTTVLSGNTATGLTVVVPAGATTGPLTVTTATGTSNALPFAVLLDLIVSTGTAGSPTGIAANTYRNLTVTGTGYGTLLGNVSVSGALLVQADGGLNLGCFGVAGAGSVTVAAGATLGICAAPGLSSAAGTGTVQVTGLRSYSDDATYVYNGVAAQVTGDQLPGIVRELGLANNAGLALTQGVLVRQRVNLTTGNLTLNGQDLTLLSGPAGTALVHNAGGLVLGNTGTMQRYIATNAGANGYRHYSSPVQGGAGGATVATLAAGSYVPNFGGAAAYNTVPAPGLVMPFPTLFTYNQDRIAGTISTYSVFDKGWQAVTSGTDPLQAGRGYAVNIPGAALVDFTGTFTTGTVSRANLNRASADPNTGWHLLGNPFPAPLNWTTMALGTGQPLDGVDGAVYVFQSSGPYTGGYRSYLAGAPGNSSPIIPAGSGFFVHVSSPAAPGIVRFGPANRITTFGPQPAFGRSTADLRPVIALALTNAANTLRDEATLYADPRATPGFNAALDAHKLPNPHGLGLALAAPSGERLAIDARPALTDGLVVPLVLTVPAAGRYTLAAPTVAHLPAPLTAALLDRATGTRTPLGAGTAYAFALSPAEAAAPLVGRFALVFGPAAGPLGTAAGAAAPPLALYPNPARGFTALTGAAPHAAVRVLDAVGRTVLMAPADASGTARLVLPVGLAAGVYVVQSGGQALRLAVE